MTPAGFRDPGFDFALTYGAETDRLRGFFIPSLSRAVQYDRATGYFTSSALVSVARGLAQFLHNGGRMRLLAGAQLDDDDLRALEGHDPLDDVVARRLLADPIDGADIIAKHRLEVLAWMLKEDRLDIRIGVPVSADGRLLTRVESNQYFHKKTGILTDARGDRIAFSGSNNESHTGLERHGNLEEFAVYPSWREQSWEDYGKPTRERFERQWNDEEAGWRVVPLPEAVRAKVIEKVAHRTEPPPAWDPADPPPDPEDGTSVHATGDPSIRVHTHDEARKRLRELRDAPKVDGGTGVGIVTAPVIPWPHQSRIAHRITRTFPRSYLLADEVGMGKTIEAGLVFRELLLSGKAETILALVPASVIKQWQEELWEKFLLRVPRFDGGKFFYRTDGDDEEVTPARPGGSPWNAFPFLLASSHLARRKARQDDVIAAGPWDVVFVDEAHHARRRGSKPTDTPNALLRLLTDMRDAGIWKALYLASATPMQMHAHEAWDLLHLLGLTERWGSSADAFVRYYEHLREDAEETDWQFLRRMLADHFTDEHNQASPRTTREIEDKFPSRLNAKRIVKFHERNESNERIRAFSTPELDALRLWLRDNTPMKHRVFRTTRTTLHRYKRTGLLPDDTNIPTRNVRDRFIHMSSDEARLYRRIEDYIRRYYNRYRNGPADQKALGFIMTIYRRRLTSSFHAIRRSLQKRLAALDQDDLTLQTLVDEDDALVAEYGNPLFDVENVEAAKETLAHERGELTDFINRLEDLPPDESKMQLLHERLDQGFRAHHDTAVIFTQYGDTLHYLRERLAATYGASVATWSGQGGTRYDPTTKTWERVPKTTLKNLFRAGEAVKILIGTDSMSEGLNLQTCGLVVNYDMPWNFMRVEQRIGRLDRIGGQPVVDVENYFYEDTVEQQIYETLSEDFDWFENVVGPASPVLGSIERIIEDAAMADADDAQSAIDTAVGKIRKGVDEANAQPVDLDQAASDPYDEDPDPALTLADLEHELTNNPLTQDRFAPSHEASTYTFTHHGASHRVTFDRDLAAEKGVPLFTYGSWLFEELLTDLVERDA